MLVLLFDYLYVGLLFYAWCGELLCLLGCFVALLPVSLLFCLVVAYDWFCIVLVRLVVMVCW